MNQQPEKSGDRLVVLVAEDNTNHAQLILRSLEELEIVDRLALVQNGEDTLRYLQGEEPFSDRAPYPVPQILLMNCRLPLLSGLGVLCWVRSRPIFEKLPIVLLGDSFSAAQIETVRQMNGACCVKGSRAAEMKERLAQGISLALRLGWENHLSGMGGETERPANSPLFRQNGKSPVAMGAGRAGVPEAMGR